jgi:hypothetical protein
VALRLIIQNGQRSEAITNCLVKHMNTIQKVTEGHFILRVIMPCHLTSLSKVHHYVSQPDEHKTATQFVCNLVLDQSLYDDLQTFFQARKNLPGEHLFCDTKGDALKSNYLGTVAKKVFGASVREMRKVPYYLVS